MKLVASWVRVPPVEFDGSPSKHGVRDEAARLNHNRDAGRNFQFGRPQEQMVMIVHEDRGMDFNAEAFGNFGNEPKETAAVVSGQEDPIPALTAIDPMIPPSSNQNAQRP